MKLIFLILFPFLCFGQGLIINEISNGTTGTQEYYELVVIGSSSNPLGNVDLGGWIIDDNNGDFEGFTTTGIATGHIRIKPGFYSSVHRPLFRKQQLNSFHNKFKLYPSNIWGITILDKNWIKE